MKVLFLIISIISLLSSLIFIFESGRDMYYYGFFALGILNSIMNILDYIGYLIEKQLNKTK